MGDEGKATRGLSELSADKNKTRKYFNDWHDDQIVSGAGSKNIPLLKFAHDLVVADRKNDSAMLNKCHKAYKGYFAACKKHGHFLGEEYSTIYWRWIVTPIWIARCVAQKRGWVEALAMADKWLRDFVVVCSLTAWPTLIFYGSKYSKDKGRQLYGTPCSLIGLARSWIYNKGSDDKRTWDDSMSWVDATSHSPWLAWVLGKASISQLGGGSGWVREMFINFSRIYSPKPVITEAARQELVLAVDDDVYPQKLVGELEYGPTKPIVVGKTTDGTWCVGERSYTYGSTSFMQAKVFPSNVLSYQVYGVAHPLKRTNPDPATATLSPDFRLATVVPDDGTYIDMDKQKEVSGNLTVPLTSGNFAWVVRLVRGKPAQRLDKPDQPPPPPGGGDDDDGGWCDWFTGLFG